jgi:hypothetical protein
MFKEAIISARNITWCDKMTTEKRIRKDEKGRDHDLI